MRAEVGPKLAHTFHHGREVYFDGLTHPHSERAGLLCIEHGAPGGDDGFGGHAAHIETVPAQERLLDQGNLRSETCCACRRYQPSRPRADDDKIVAGRRGGILPIRGVNIRHESRIVRVSRFDQDRSQVDAHHLFGVCSVLMLPIFFANALLATRVTNTVTVTVARSPTPYKAHSPVVRCRCPAPTLTSEPR